VITGVSGQRNPEKIGPLTESRPEPSNFAGEFRRGGECSRYTETNLGKGKGRGG